MYTPANRSSSTLTAEFVHGTDNTLALAAVTGFNASGGYIRVYEEQPTGSDWALYEYTGISTLTLTGLTPCTLGVVESTAAHTFAVGTKVEVTTAAEYIKGVIDVVNAHKNRHDPNDGADPLDTAGPSELAGVQAQATGASHSFARADHAHQIQHGIADNHLVTVDHNVPVATDYARFTANGLEGREPSEVRTDLGLVIGTNVLAEQTIGIADNNLVEVDGPGAGAPASGEYARWTANGLEGRSAAEIQSDLGTLLADGSIPLTSDWDVGAHGIRAATLTADGLTSGRVVFAGTNGLLSDSADLTFASNLFTVKKDAIAASQGDYGLALVNTTAALVGAQVQYSPPIRQRGTAWDVDGSVSNTVDFRQFVRPIAGNGVAGALDIQASINGGAYSDLLTVLSTGIILIGTASPDATSQLNLQVTGGISANGQAVGTPTTASIIVDYNAAGYGRIMVADGIGGWVKELTLNPYGGKVGVATVAPGQIFDVNSGSGNMIADGYDTHPSTYAFKENTIAVTGGMIDKLKSFKLFEFTRKPYVSADELRTATINHFSKGRWVKAFGGEIVEDENGVETIQGDDYHGGKLRTCPDKGMLEFIDAHAEKLRVERRKLPEWTRKHLGPILDDPGTKEALGDVIHYDEDGKITGYSLNDQVGFLEGCLREVVDIALDLADRVNILEAV